jgi:hypothetical protein
MRMKLASLLSLVLLCLTGCQSHLVFLEEDHVGLKAQFQPNNPSPAQITLGYRRGILAVVPQQSANPTNLINPVSVTRTTNSITVCENPNELMSLYTVFRANIGFGDPTEVHHFMATGMAANALLANHEDLRNLSAIINNPTK